MAGQPADILPAELVHALDERRLSDPDQPAYLLVTTDPDGAPRISMLSAGELLARDERTLRVALWPGTGTAANLSRGGAALVGLIAPGLVVYVRTQPVPLRVPETARLECFELTATGVKADAHPGMPVTSGIAFRVPEPDRPAAVAAWRRQRDLLARAQNISA
jgi:hypothetical protein